MDMINRKIKCNYSTNLKWAKEHPPKASRDMLIRQMCFMEAVLETLFDDIPNMIISFEEMEQEFKNDTTKGENKNGYNNN